MTNVKTNFTEQTIYVGLDVHKRSWNTALYLNDQYLRNVHQPPSPRALYKFLQTNYPGANYVCAYEGGKFGYWILRQLGCSGVECIVVNPADIRRHRQLRSDLIECAWTAKRTDPALSLFYSEQLKRGKEPKLIIVKIARKLLSRISYVWLTEKAYERGVVK